MADAHTALVVDDEEGVRFVIARALQAAGLKTVGVATLEAARRALSQQRFVAAFVDIRLPDGNGLDLARDLAQRADKPLLVVMTAQDTVEHAIEAMRRGADEYLVKPFAIADVQQLARNAIERARLASDPAPREPEETPPYGLIGRSAAMREIYKRIGRAAATDLPVLIEGESGTGKELVARALHASSTRAAGPFVALNLAALPAELVESELYGHEKGAFTGATSARPGHFELAHGGTLLLDEVGELPLELQPKLLRALQEGEISRVGGARPTRVDVRILAATNVDLARAVATGRFRADLYYRLRVLPLRLPSLRERPEDVPVLAAHFLRRDGPKLRGREMRFTADAAELLARHAWPGNVRELENVVRAALVESTDATVSSAELRAVMGMSPDAATTGWEGGYAALVRARLGSDQAYARLLEEAERIVLREALSKAQGNQVRAAALLGIHRNSLRRRMVESGLEPAENA